LEAEVLGHVFNIKSWKSYTLCSFCILLNVYLIALFVVIMYVLMYILSPLRLVGLGVVLTRLIAACTLGMLASLLAFANVLTYCLSLCHPSKIKVRRHPS
jgi:predicted anti-sigma-YlaC factor YlaD